MTEEKSPIDPVQETPAKLGIKIEKPSSIPINAIFPILLIISFVLVGGTLCLLSFEYLGQTPPTWLRSIFDNLILAF